MHGLWTGTTAALAWLYRERSLLGPGLPVATDESISASRSHRVHKLLSADEMSFAESNSLRRSDGEEVPLAGYTLELVCAAVLELQP
jgi:hypothetical protein